MPADTQAHTSIVLDSGVEAERRRGGPGTRSRVGSILMGKSEGKAWKLTCIGPHSISSKRRRLNSRLSYGDTSFRHIYNLERFSSTGFHACQTSRSLPVPRLGNLCFPLLMIPLNPGHCPQLSLLLLSFLLCSPTRLLLEPSSGSRCPHQMSPFPLLFDRHTRTICQCTLQSPALPRARGHYTQMLELSLPSNVSTV